MGPGLLSLRSSGLKEERRERSANNSFLLLNFLSGERGQVTGRETEEGNEGGLASDIATKDGRMDGGLQRSEGKEEGSKQFFPLFALPLSLSSTLPLSNGGCNREGALNEWVPGRS